MTARSTPTASSTATMSRTWASIPNGGGRSLLRPRPRRSTATRAARSPSARAVASQVRLVEVMPWMATTSGAPASLPAPSR